MCRFILCLLLACSSWQAFAEKKPDSSQRIIALAPHIVEILYAIGAGDRIVGTTAYSDYPEQAKKILQIGGYHGVQIEKIMELEPDLVIAWPGGNKADDLAKLKSLGIPMAYSRAEKVEEVAREVRKYGRLTGLEHNAEKVAMAFEQRLAKLKTKYQGKSSVNVFYQLWWEPLRTVGPGSWLQHLLEFCSASNVFADAASDYPLISKENVIIKKPEVMIVPENHGTHKTQEILSLWGQWPQIPAIKHNHIYTVHSDLLHRTTPRMLEGLEDLCNKIDKARN